MSEKGKDKKDKFKDVSNTHLSTIHPDKELDRESVPPAVENPEAWYKYIELKKQIYEENSHWREFETSNPLITVDLFTPINHLRPKIATLPKEERDIIEKKFKAVKVLMGRMNSYKNKAFGIKSNGVHSYGQHLLDARLGELIEYFGRFYTVDEVHKIVVDEWGLPCSRTTLDKFRQSHIDKIEQRQDEYKASYTDIRLGHKRSRLEELSYLYNSRKEKYKEFEKQTDYKLLLQTLDQIKKEVEVDTLRIEGDVNHNVNHTINVHIQQEIMKNMTINDIIIGRVAARLKVSASYITERLHKSLYAKHSGFGEQTVLGGDDEKIYPSSMVYDWKEIEKQHTPQAQEQRRVEKQPEFIEDAKIVQDSETYKEALLKKIKEKKDRLNQATDRVNKHDKGN